MTKELRSESIEKRIFTIRGHRVMLSPHLAELYGVEPRALVQAVKRNLDRFPEDFMFQLNEEEFQDLKSQFVISSWGGARRAFPYAFTELFEIWCPLQDGKGIVLRIPAEHWEKKCRSGIILA